MPQINTLIREVQTLCQGTDLSALDQIVLLDLFVLTLELEVTDRTQVDLFIQVIGYINQVYISDGAPIPPPEKQSDRDLFSNNSLDLLSEHPEFIPAFAQKRLRLLEEHYPHLLFTITRHRRGNHEEVS